MSKKNKFPTTQAGKMALAQQMLNGFTENADIYPAPPNDLAAQKTRIQQMQESLDKITQIEAALRAAVAEKDEIDDEMDEEMKENIAYAELVSKGDDAKLKKIGWSGRAAPQSMQKPGQPRALEIINQGAGWMQIDWKEPPDGGRVQFYKILRRDTKSGGDMGEAGSSSISEATLVNQPRGITMEYVVIAVNKAGESLASNTITITL